MWAAGDVTGGLQFTHVADYMAKTVLRNALLPGSTRVDYGDVPWVTYTDPEVAHVGLSEAEAGERGGRTYSYELDDLDRAIVDGEARGVVKISVDTRGRSWVRRSSAPARASCSCPSCSRRRTG